MRRKVGKGWHCVHIWLDEYAKKYGGWQGHRCHRHHIEGIEEVRKRWGNEAAKVAELHILSDFGFDYVPDEEFVHKYYKVEYRKDGKYN